MVRGPLNPPKGDFDYILLRVVENGECSVYAEVFATKILRHKGRKND
jgi:hypothetical protein